MKTSAAAVCFLVPTVACAAGGKGSEGGSMMVAVLQMLASLAIVIGIIYLLYYVSTRWLKGFPGGKARRGHIRVIETRHLAPKRSLMIVEVGGEYLLLGSGSEGVQLIKKLENGEGVDAEIAASPLQPVPELFRRKFDEVLGKMRGGLTGMKKTDFAMKKIWCADDGSAGPLTVEQMIERMNAGKNSPAAGARTTRRRTREAGAVC